MSDDSYRYLSFRDLQEDIRFPFSRGQLRHVFCKRTTNGLDAYVIKIGKSLYVRDDDFVKWLDSHKSKSAVESLKKQLQQTKEVTE